MSAARIALILRRLVLRLRASGDRRRAMDRSPSTSVGLLAATALALGGCVTTVEPRAYLPVVQPPPTDIAAFERDFSACASQVSEDAAVFYRSHPELKAVK